jgi:hypothetical protein
MSLSERHRHMLEVESAIARDVHEERGYCTVEKKVELARFGFGRALQIVPSLVISVHGVVADEPPWYVHRPDRTPIKDGRPRKYLLPTGRTMALDIHPRARPHLGDPSAPLFVTEGPRKVDALISAGALAVVGLLGVWSWRGTNQQNGKTLLPDWEFVHLSDRQVFVVYDSDVMLKEPVRQAMDRLGAVLSRRGANVAFVYLPAGEGGVKTGADDFIARGKCLDDVIALASSELRRPPGLPSEPRREPERFPAVSLLKAVATYQRWLHLPDPEPLYVTMGAIVSNRLPGDPAWLLLVGRSGAGKTEIVRACSTLPECVPVSVLSEPALLSGTPHADRAEGATGGALREIGARGTLVCKDFTSVLAMARDQQAGTLAALREIHDGYWPRPIGADGGRRLLWEGKCGLVGGVTHEIDRAFAVMSRMGERLLLYRMAPFDEDKAIMRAIENREFADQMRHELRRASLGVFAGLSKTLKPRSPSPTERAWLVELVKFVARGRAGADRDHRGELVAVISPEVPTRLAQQLEGLLAGMGLIGVPREDALRAVTNTALGCIPALRRRVLDALAFPEPDTLLDTARRLPTTTIAIAVGHPTRTVHRTLEELTGHDLVERESQGKGKADLWELRSEARELLERARRDVLPDDQSCTCAVPEPRDGVCERCWKELA